MASNESVHFSYLERWFIAHVGQSWTHTICLLCVLAYFCDASSRLSNDRGPESTIPISQHICVCVRVHSQRIRLAKLASNIYFSANDSSKTLAEEALMLIKSGAQESDFGEPFLLGKNFSSKSISEIERSFGKQFSENIQNIIPKEWSGPLDSEYGSHLIYVNSISDSFTPSLEEIKNIVINDVILEKQNNSVTEYLKELRNKYQIEILADFNETAN